MNIKKGLHGEFIMELWNILSKNLKTQKCCGCMLEKISSILKFAFSHNIWYNSIWFVKMFTLKKESDLYFKQKNNILY